MKILFISILVIVCVIALYALILYIDMRNEAKECESLHAVWHDRRRKIFGLPLSFDRYSFSTDRIFLSSGLFSTKEDEVRLYRVLDLSISRTFFQKIFNVGDIVMPSWGIAYKVSSKLIVDKVEDSPYINDLTP